MLRFFINRPIFASVISIIIVLAGTTALRVLPVEQYPEVVPPEVVVNASYPGASAEVVAEAVAAPLEQEINGVDDMLYMESTTTDDGTLQIVVTFEMGTDPDMASVNVNNRVEAALPRLPQAVRDQGVRAEDRSTNILMVPVLYSPDESRDSLFIANYAIMNVLEELNRLPGVGEASVFAPEDYSMRIWQDPDKLARHDLTPSDLADAIREQSAHYAAGRIGADPAPAGVDFTYSVSTDEMLAEPEEYEDIILRSGKNVSTLRLGDVARAELGPQRYGFSAEYNGQQAVGMGVFLAPGANAMETAEVVNEALEEMSVHFPEGLDYTMGYDVTEFIEASIQEVLITLLIAMALVVLVTFIFLQRLRATLIPVTAIPVSIIGTFAGMLAMGFSVNLLTLFGLVLSIGIVVDNAIIVMENVERLMRERSLKAREASIETMKQVAGAVLASTLVLVAVFAPSAFLGGMTGELYRQFAVTIAVSVVVSGVVALTLTPAMCALLLDRQRGRLPRPFVWFNRAFEMQTSAYVWVVSKMVRHAAVGVLLFAVFTGATVYAVTRMAPGLIPQEDQGGFIMAMELPAASSLSRTEQARDKVMDGLMEMEEVESFTGIAGVDIFDMALRSHMGMGFVNLTHWDERQEPGQDAQSMTEKVMGMGQEIQEANILAFVPPPIVGLSLAGGVEGYLEVRGDMDVEELEAMAWELMAAANERPELVNARTTLETDIPNYRADLDREKSRDMGVPVNQVYETMQSTFGTLYVGDFTMQDRNWQVNLQSEKDFRSRPEDLSKVFVRSEHGQMLPLTSLVSLERDVGPDVINRYNVNSAARLMADAAPGYTTGEAKEAVEEVAEKIIGNGETSLGWIGEAFQLDVAAGAGGTAFGLGLVMVVLILAAQYERWTLPLAVASAVPFGVLGASLAAMLRGFPNDIYFQVGLLVLIGLAAKNAILIVAFAAQNRENEGMNSTEAALSAARQRFRPIVMTAMTFIIGVLPLVFATGAGAASRQVIGTVVVGGMLLASTVAILFVPLFYKLMDDVSFYFHNRKMFRDKR
ncbi:transporter, hydrophobe/amphiphile efflux-1 (HAE1) family [Desulfonatronospira thiodismutans ASO3-1]|uniref:Transporter, hydrophobe/amphiphile efflux-1 (HAE1) family n=1 Tax=Desulfonatronospira thiodismutans ASO3-1 TaxID=555779 RepID=D6SKD7_9BACT|nr:MULTISPECIES: multidrug efflux RND transporter permease subunit [Desulfonatronospira]EFI36340.1 transporter, hydrophobe/amphiphile efflux-1 (HAE1) family [Desulfonatronospira thiodismutans ASO3-1]RQD79190.1 MAG: multidrug efflux RND transporter permease subunit [Desulfonatronospira sp. MSAO_Bac3]